MAIKGHYTLVLTYNGQTDEILNVPADRYSYIELLSDVYRMFDITACFMKFVAKNGLSMEDDDDLLLVFELYKDSRRGRGSNVSMRGNGSSVSIRGRGNSVSMRGSGSSVSMRGRGKKTNVLPGGESKSEISLIEIEDNGDYSEEVMFNNAISSEESDEDFVLNDSEDDGLSNYASDNEVNVDDSENETYDHMHRKKRIH
ncbi:hypothetical protein P3X46_000422 [Hevea brasiliensis]|uniref:PB1 domain-containing protein n=1 Tax=Hevea brasiliensis TaxID=3981 RepID=A0ABQ9N9A0_HEVBR|nr:hypothetical protein P3X46_000422 [Hevea brasiliensis]